MKEGGHFGGHTISGMKFERQTDLARFIGQHYDLQPLSSIRYKPKELNRSFDVYDNDKRHIGYITRKIQFHKVLKEFYNVDFNARKITKWQPDDVYINQDTNTIYIIEKKYQRQAGSTAEKILTFPEKSEHYRHALEAIPIKDRPKLIFVAVLNEDFWLNSNGGKDYEYELNCIMRKGIWVIFDEYTFEMFGLR